ncbi:metallophosphoesterase [Anaerosacchariphilus polymeriproducens]|uniref:Metallophosphoesterase n=1 Tax=Anaerosacchariphilus polymeriproducens TaxID=1812858 RepID=A0A371AZ18_9FIRM|nr:metallophosphoesterase [Anaerosacchariphilus polymeriproducens]RDU24793.1 metallophosphoesterase [Anaerosacchariphilus polymeriproducens]
MKKQFKFKKIIFLLIAMPLISISLFLIIGIFENQLGITTYEYKSNKIPENFNNYSIVQISDLHSSYFGKEQDELIDAVSKSKPDLILLTGDMIDRKNTDYNSVSILFEKLVQLAPVYAISGNHELESDTIYNKMNTLYLTYGITLLDNKSTQISRGNSKIQIAGLKHWGSMSYKCTSYYVEKNTPHLENNTFGILLNHRSDMLSYFSKSNYSLVLSGHTHGGIIRLPYFGGLINNDATLLPKYDSGIFTENQTTLIVNRGLGNSNFIPRVYNPPEIIHILLKVK